MLTCLATINKDVIDNTYFIKQLLEDHIKERNTYVIYNDSLSLEVESDRQVIKRESTFFSDFEIESRTLEMVVITTQKTIEDYNTIILKEHIVIKGTWEEVKEVLGEELYHAVFMYIYLKKVRSTAINSKDENLFSHEDLMVLYPEMGMDPGEIEVLEPVDYEDRYYDEDVDIHMAMSDEYNGAPQ